MIENWFYTVRRLFFWALVLIPLSRYVRILSKKVEIEVLKDKKLFPKIKKSGQYLVIAGIESSSITLFDLKESKEITTVTFEDNIVLDFDLCKETNEIGLLLKSTSINERKPKYEEKSVQLRAITPQGFQVIEILETFGEAETLSFLTKPNLLLVEGNRM